MCFTYFKCRGSIKDKKTRKKIEKLVSKEKKGRETNSRFSVISFSKDQRLPDTLTVGPNTFLEGMFTTFGYTF